MLKIYGADLSSPSNKVRFVANYLQLEYEYIRVNIRGGQNRTPEYLAMHPAGKVPVIDDDGFVLFESDAICKYLAQKKGSPIYPPDLQMQALVDQWVHFATIHVGGAMSKVLYNLVFAPVIGAEVDERSMKDGYNFLNKFLPVIDRQLAKSRYLVSGQFTVADTCLLAALDPSDAAQVDLTSYGSITKWREGLVKEEFYSKCHRTYQGALARVMAAR